ncbi:hypothetical protein HJFPF1_04739 [Paramyrothecium foliicola]|nr:hypothetical protein HJFPF1_04739 [Paramyrothecium foliicola]
MATAEMPSMRLADSGLRIVLLPTLDEVPSSPVSLSDNGHGHIDNPFRDDGSYHEPSDNPDIPTHPIPSMQEAFAESLEEVTLGAAAQKPNLRALDAKARRERLLDQGRDDEPLDAIWRYRPGQRQHEVVKLIAQIAFGVYLLLNGMANDQAQVVEILQGHIDEVDQFLEVAFEDLAQATQDMNGRIEHLQLPMQNLQVFEELLEDRKFRTEILEGNEKIDHILARNDVAMKQWDDDIDAGLRCTTAFSSWLSTQKDTRWRTERPDLDDIFSAMKHNAEGWLNAFDEMNSLTQEINGLTIRLMTIHAEMEKKAGEISRDSWASAPAYAFPLPGSPIVPPPVPSPQISSSVSSPRDISPQVGSARILESHASSLRFASPRSSSTPPVTQQSRASSHADLSPRITSQMDSPVLPPSRPMSQRTSSMQSRHSMRSTRQSISRHSVRSASGPTVLHATEVESLDLDDFGDFPLPGSAPLLPPLRNNARNARQKAANKPPPSIDATEKIVVVNSPVQAEPEPHSTSNDESLYILQPRVYTPKPTEAPMSPISPKLRAALTLAAQLETQRQSRQSTYSMLQKRLSLRQRVSLKTSPPEAIHIPPRVNPDAMLQRPLTGDGTPPTSNSLGPDSAYGSDGEHHYRQPYRVGSLNELSEHARPGLVHSPRSEHQQYYHPVRASPHSPLQQRPHTAVPGETGYRPSVSYPQYNRNQPSRLGGMSMLSNVTTATQIERSTTPTSQSQAGDKQLRKKRSTFGWLKKAFSLDEEEKAAFEARKALRYEGPQYYDDQSPKFLDGKRLR